MNNKPALKVIALSKSFADAQAAGGSEVLHHLDLEVEQGEFLCILGPSGCGKSTFLRCVAGFERYEGEIQVDGKTISGPGTDRIMVFQDFAQLFPWKTVEKNIQYPLRISGIRDRKELERLAKEYLDKVELSAYASFYPHQLSGGMKQRVAIARALVLRPRLILMDEPLASLDAMTRNNLQGEILRMHQQEKMTVIFITHNIQEAICLGTRILILSDKGTILYDKRNTLQKPTSPALEGYGQLWGELHDVLYQARRPEQTGTERIL